MQAERRRALRTSPIEYALLPGGGGALPRPPGGGGGREGGGGGHTVESGYRVTGAFLKWAEGGHPGLVLALDKALRAGQYTPALWQTHTGKALPALWSAYAGPRMDAPTAAPAGHGKR